MIGLAQMGDYRSVFRPAIICVREILGENDEENF